MSLSLLGFTIMEREQEIFKPPRRDCGRYSLRSGEAMRWMLNWVMSALSRDEFGTWIDAFFRFSSFWESFSEIFSLQFSFRFHRSVPLTSIHHEHTYRKRGPIKENGHRFSRSSWYDFSRLVRNFQFDQTGMYHKPILFFLSYADSYAHFGENF